MKGEGKGRQLGLQAFTPLDENAPSVKLWQAIDATDQRVTAQTGTPLLPQTSRQILHLYLTTGATAKHLLPITCVGCADAVRYQLRRGLEIVFPHLPDEVRQEYQTPKQALRSRSGRRSYSELETKSISHGNLARWQRYREVEKPQGKPAFSEEGLANIHAHSGRRKKQT